MNGPADFGQIVTCIVPVSCRFHMGRQYHRHHTDTTQTPHRYHTGTTQIPHRYHIDTTQTPHRYHVDTTSDQELFTKILTGHMHYNVLCFTFFRFDNYGGHTGSPSYEGQWQPECFDDGESFGDRGRSRWRVPWRSGQHSRFSGHNFDRYAYVRSNVILFFSGVFWVFDFGTTVPCEQKWVIFRSWGMLLLRTVVCVGTVVSSTGRLGNQV